MYKLIACDLDDTLLNSNFEVSKEDKESISKLNEKGIYFTIATGRVTKSAKKYAEELKLEVPYISFNGGKITDPKSDKQIYSRELKKDIIIEIIKYAERAKIHCNIYTEDKVIVKEKNRWTDYYKTFARNFPIKEVGTLSEYDFKSTPKLILIDENKKLKKAFDEINKIKDDKVNMFFSKPNFLEFTEEKATKGEALRHIANLYNIDRNKVAALGDSFNDISMLEYAGLSAAVENASKEIKNIVDYVTTSNDENGLTNFLNKYIFSK